MTYKEFYIVKKNKSFRRICAPDKELLQQQRIILQRLNIIFNEKITHLFNSKKVFHGFVKGHSYITAAKLHVGYAHTICLDISNCFDSIKYDLLPLDNLFKNQNKQYCAHSDGTLAQGFATSPMLANIYMIQPISEVYKMLTELFTDFALTVYADDIQISLPSTDYTTINAVVIFVTNIMKKYHLVINNKKTRVRHKKFGNRKILGIQVSDIALNPSRKLKKKIRAARFQKNISSLGGLINASRFNLPKTMR